MKYFTLTELTATQTGLQNVPSAEQKRNLERLCTILLDPLRELHGSPLYVSSGFRSPEVNKKVGGVSNSQHLQGLAADIYPAGSVKELFTTILQFGYFDQCIWYQTKQFIHVSVPQSGAFPRRQVIVK